MREEDSKLQGGAVGAGARGGGQQFAARGHPLSACPLLPLLRFRGPSLAPPLHVVRLRANLATTLFTTTRTCELFFFWHPTYLSLSLYNFFLSFFCKRRWSTSLIFFFLSFFFVLQHSSFDLQPAQLSSTS